LRLDSNPVAEDPSRFSITASEGEEMRYYETDGLHVLPRSMARQQKIGLLVDYTRSMDILYGTAYNEGNVKNMLVFDFINRLDEDIQVSFMEFHVPELFAVPAAVDYTVDRETLRETILQLAINAPSDALIWDNVIKALETFEYSQEPLPQQEDRYLLLCSDGRNNQTNYLNDDPLEIAASYAQTLRVKIFTIGFNDGLANVETAMASLERLSTETGGRFYEVTDDAGIGNALTALLSELQSQYNIRWVTPRGIENTAYYPAFSITLESGASAAYQETEDSFRPAALDGEKKEGRLHLVTSDNGVASTVFLRADYMPRYMGVFRIYIATDYGLQPVTGGAAHTQGDEAVEIVSDGLLANWTMDIVEEESGLWLILQSPTAFDDLVFSTAGPMLRFNFTEIIPALQDTSTGLHFDSTVYEEEYDAGVRLPGFTVTADGAVCSTGLPEGVTPPAIE
jgi:hypothetical protein